MKITVFLLSLFLLHETTLSNNYLAPEPVSWDELINIQKDTIDKMNLDYSLSPQCFQDIASYHHMKGKLYLQNILWNNYVWEKYTMPDGLECIILIMNFGKHDQQKKVLSQEEGTAFISASEGIGFEKNGFFEYSDQLNYHNLKLAEQEAKNAQKHLNFDSDFVLDTKDQIQLYDTYAKIPFQINRPHKTIQNKNGLIKDDGSRGAAGRTSISHNESFNYPYYAIGQLTTNYSNNCTGGYGTAFLVSSNVSITSAHTLYNSGCGFPNDGFVKQASHIHSDGSVFSHFGSLLFVGVANAVISNEYYTYPLSLSPYDYGAIRYYANFTAPSYIPITTDLFFGSGNTISAIGYPDQTVSSNAGMWEHNGVLVSSSGSPQIDSNIDISSQLFFDSRPAEIEEGMSGAPAFRNSENAAFGIVSFGILLGEGEGIGIINGFTVDQFNQIVEWLYWNPTVIMTFPTFPVTGETYNLVEMPDFSVVLSEIKQMKLNGTIMSRGKDLSSLVEWESSVNGSFGNGLTVTSEELKTSLSEGVHLITAKIDSQGEQGEISAYINIEVPEGSFTSNEYCILDLGGGEKGCEVDISWIVTNSPLTPVVWNETTNMQFASGFSGSKPLSVTTSGTELKLYPSDEKIILLDSANVEAKVPTGSLIAPNNICSLEPSPFAPDGSARDSKATPPGCGIELSWSNVQWASPSIFYRVYGGSWQHLYQIPCDLGGEICSDSINTDSLIPELVPASGAEFKLLQFNEPSSGELSAPINASGYRFADAYEYDDGSYLGAAYLAPGPQLTTDAVLGVAQHNHNFHDRSGSVLGNDVDSVQINGNLYDGEIVAAKVFNMAPDLAVNMDVMCAGTKTESDGGKTGEPQPGLWPFNNSPIITTTTQNGETTMRFTAQSGESYTTGGTSSVLNCIRNRIVISRIGGDPSENLTYSVIVNLENNNTPTINEINTVCTNNYCPRLLGSNFPADAWVSIRENTPGSSELTQYSGNLIYVRTPLNGQDRLQFPIPEPTIQAKFRSPGLCFKVMGSNGSSNEMCHTRPATVDQLPLLGSTVESFALSQDLQFDTFSTKVTPPQIKMWGNSWKKIYYNYTLTSNTVLEFEFRSNKQEPEINGIGLIKTGESGMPSSQFWQVFGTQDYGHQQFHDYVNNAGFKFYRIPVGQFITGQIKEMVFVADEDNRVGQNTIFKNMVLKEGSGIDGYDDVPAQRPYDDDVRERGVSWTNGTTEQFHTFHDANDIDWTLVYSQGPKRFRTELIGANSDTKMQVYEWISADTHPSGDGTYINVVDQLIGEDTSIGASEFIVNSSSATIYAIKVESKNGHYGAGTEYKFVVDSLSALNSDQYDSVPGFRTYHDDIREQAVSWRNEDSQHFHNFHDANDSDWTIVYAQGLKRYKTNLIGASSDTKMSVFKWISAEPHPSGDGRYINVVDQLVGTDDGPGGSEVVINASSPTIYAIRVQSRMGSFGTNTEYSLVIETPTASQPDQFDNVPTQRDYDDDVRERAVSWLGGTTQHFHNFHDSGDSDWTLIYAGVGNTQFRTELIGSNADTRMYVYKWISAQPNPDGTYSNVVDQFIDSDVSTGASVINVDSSEPTFYAVRVESRNGSFGSNTAYKLIIQ